MRVGSRTSKTMTVAVVLGAGLAWVAPFFPCLCRAEEPTLAFVQAPKADSQPAGLALSNSFLAGRYLRGMRIALAELGNIAATSRVVTEDFVSATDPVFDYDGTRLVFAGQRRSEDALQIWQASGGNWNPEQIVVCDADCISPVYLPGGDVLFASLLSREYEEHGGQYSFSLYKAGLNRDVPERITFNPSSDFDPTMLADGRILYSSWQHVGNYRWPTGTIALMLVNSDGTGVFPFTGSHRDPWLKRGGTAWDGDRVAFIRSEQFTQFGAGVLDSTSLNDAFAEYDTLVPGDRYLVSDVAPLPAGGLILSARPVDDADATFGLYTYIDGQVKLLYDDPKYHELNPTVAKASPRPEMRISTVVPDTPFGYLAILNCYDTDRTDQHPLREGSIGTVRVLEGQPLRHDGQAGPSFLSVPQRDGEPLIRPNSATGVIPTRILGEVPPAADGSVYLKVPSDRPLRIQLVDQDGFSIVNERAWFWVRPNERRVCLGCHEDRERAPGNVMPAATRRAPTDMTDPSGWQTVSFRNDIQPIVNMNCALADCHMPPTPTAGMNLSKFELNDGKDAVLADHFGPAYANLLARQKNKPYQVGGRRVHPGNARSSPMLWMLYGRALAPQYKPAPFERPMIGAHPGPMLPEAQLELIRKWIDLGAQYDDESPAGPWPYRFPGAQKLVMEELEEQKRAN